jgi:hypothetical protein
MGRLDSSVPYIRPRAQPARPGDAQYGRPATVRAGVVLCMLIPGLSTGGHLGAAGGYCRSVLLGRLFFLLPLDLLLASHGPGSVQRHDADDEQH